MDRLQRRAKEYRAAGAQLVIISADAPKFLLQIKQKRKLKDLMLLSDDDLKLINTLETREGKRRISRPATFVLDKRGRVVWRHIGNDECDRPAESTVLGVIRKLLRAPTS